MPSHAPVCAWMAACVCAWSLPAAAQERPASDLVDAIVRDGPRAQAIRAEADVVRREQLARVAFPNPTVSWSREGAGFTEFFQVAQALPVFGIRGALARAGVAASAAAEAERDARLWTLRAEAAERVSRLQAADLRAEAANAEVKVAERLVALLRVREKEGESSRFDRMRAEQDLADIRRAASDADVAALDARAALAAMLPADVALTRVVGAQLDERPAPDVAALQTRATSSRAEVAALARASDAALLEAEAARREQWPQPVVTGGFKRADDSGARELGGIVGIAVNMPLFDTGSRRRARWQAQAARLTAERAAIERQVRADVVRAAGALARREQALASDAGQADAAELVRTADVAYREGDIGVLALLDAMRTASRARVRDIDMRLDVRLAQIALERAVGERLW